MNSSLESNRVDSVMTRVLFTVRPTEKIAGVAQSFEEHDVHAAPVVNEDQVCIGVITSHDLVEYESSRSELSQYLDHGETFDMAHYGDSRSVPVLRVPIDEVGVQMTTQFESASPDMSLADAARLMCQRHLHHLVILDQGRHPIGMVSALDILGFLTDTPVVRQGPASAE